MLRVKYIEGLLLSCARLQTPLFVELLLSILAGQGSFNTLLPGGSSLAGPPGTGNPGISTWCWLALGGLAPENNQEELRQPRPICSPVCCTWSCCQQTCRTFDCFSFMPVHCTVRTFSWMISQLRCVLCYLTVICEGNHHEGKIKNYS